ncbi:MAG: DUF4402 domain-containing protein [bacterium]
MKNQKLYWLLLIICCVFIGNSIMNAQTYKEMEITVEVEVTIEPDPNPDTLPLPPPIYINLLADVESPSKDTTGKTYISGNAIEGERISVKSNLISSDINQYIIEKRLFKTLASSHSGYWKYYIDSSVSMDFGVLYSTDKAGLAVLNMDSTKTVLGGIKFKNDLCRPATVILKMKDFNKDNSKEKKVKIDLDTIYFKIELPKEGMLKNDKGDMMRINYLTSSKEIWHVKKDENSKIKITGAIELTAKQPKGTYRGKFTCKVIFVLPDIVVR